MLRRFSLLLLAILILTACEATPTPSPGPVALSTLPGMAVTIAPTVTAAPTTEAAPILLPETPTIIPGVTIAASTGQPALGPQISFWAGDTPSQGTFNPN